MTDAAAIADGIVLVGTVAGKVASNPTIKKKAKELLSKLPLPKRFKKNFPPPGEELESLKKEISAALEACNGVEHMDAFCKDLLNLLENAGKTLEEADISVPVEDDHFQIMDLFAGKLVKEKYKGLLTVLNSKLGESDSGPSQSAGRDFILGDQYIGDAAGMEFGDVSGSVNLTFGSTPGQGSSSTNFNAQVKDSTPVAGANDTIEEWITDNGLDMYKLQICSYAGRVQDLRGMKDSDVADLVRDYGIPKLVARRLREALHALGAQVSTLE